MSASEKIDPSQENSHDEDSKDEEFLEINQLLEYKHGVDCPCGNCDLHASEGGNYHWKKGIPRKDWVYDGDYIDHGGLNAHCEMCGHILRYEHLVHHPPSGLRMGVGCVCGGKMIEESALTNRTGEAMQNSDPYEILRNKPWSFGRGGKEQFKVGKNTKLFKKIVNFFDIDPKTEERFVIYLYPNGGIFIPSHKQNVESKKYTEAYRIMTQKITVAYRDSPSRRVL